jgi:hypothetical protein
MKNKQLPSKEICIRFVVDETEYAFWDANTRKVNLRFINQLDPDYFEYIAQLNLSLLNGEGNDKKTRQHAAINMRLAYSQGLEVLFSLIFATIQAHDCVIGWFLKYNNRELFSIAKKFRDGKEIYTKLALPIRGWRDFANIVFVGIEEQKEKILSKIEQFAYLWSHFFEDFLDPNLDKEYNSIKHGLRVNMGGKHYLMGLPEFNGRPVENQQWRTISKSEFGTTFFISEKIKKTPNFVVHEHSRNWNPENYFHGLMLISTSIKNILVLLNKINGSEKDTNYYFPNDENFSEKPWEIGNSSSVTHYSSIDKRKIPSITKEDILSIYETHDEKPK